MFPQSHRPRDVILVGGALLAAVLLVVWSVASSVDRQLTTAVHRVGETVTVAPVP